MTHRGRILIATLLLLLAGTAQAGVNVLGGVTLPQKRWGDLAKPGPHVGLEIAVPVIPSLLSVGGQAMLSRNELDLDVLPVAPPEDHSARWYTGELLGIARLQLPLTGAHVKAGLGVISYRYDADGDSWADIEDTTRFVGALGAGMDLGGLELQAMFHVVKYDEDADFPDNQDEVDTNFSFYTVSAALGF